jgi:hypothetical protein
MSQMGQTRSFGDVRRKSGFPDSGLNAHVAAFRFRAPQADIRENERGRQPRRAARARTGSAKAKAVKAGKPGGDARDLWRSMTRKRPISPPRNPR